MKVKGIIILTLAAAAFSQTPEPAKPTDKADGKPNVLIRSELLATSKEFDKKCLGAKITLSDSAADYKVTLYSSQPPLFSNWPLQILNKNGDLISSTKPRSRHKAVESACEIILADWSKNKK